jgi:hypothetical protein
MRGLMTTTLVPLTRTRVMRTRAEVFAPVAVTLMVPTGTPGAPGAPGAPTH